MNTAKLIRVVLSAALALSLLVGCSSEENKNPLLNSGKDPWEYTLEEFGAMSDEEQVAFRNSFESLDAFYAWVDQVQSTDVKYPWDKAGAKQPIDYTWEEFGALSEEEQIAFQNSFDSLEDFDAWLQNNEPKETMPKVDVPWEYGDKQPEDYTWEEFEALSAELQMVFQSSFDSFETFDAWLQKAQGTDETYPWEKDGAKQPAEYSWEEFEALTGELQMAFQNSFDNQAAFDAWLQKVRPQEPEDSIDIPWENGGKQPEDYTWAEFEALSAELQMIFQNSFGSFEAFDAWLQRVNP